MPQLHLYLPEEIAAKVRERAKEHNMPVSRYLAEMVKRQVGQGWPERYFERVCGQWEGEFPELTREGPEELKEAF